MVGDSCLDPAQLLEVASAGGSILVGSGLGHDQAAMVWLKGWLEAEIERAIGEDLKLLPPKIAP